LEVSNQKVHFEAVFYNSNGRDLAQRWDFSAQLYFDFRRHRYFRRHSFDHFMLFGVDSEEKRTAPKIEPPGPGSDSSSKTSPD
jgi:hypothetical protein